MESWYATSTLSTPSDSVLVLKVMSKAEESKVVGPFPVTVCSTKVVVAAVVLASGSIKLII